MGWRCRTGALFWDPPRQHQNQANNGVGMEKGCAVLEPTPSTSESGKQRGGDGRRVRCSRTHPVNNRIKCADFEPTPSTTELNALFSNPPRQHQNQANNGVEMEKGCAVLGPTPSTTESNALFSNPPRQHQNQANNGVEIEEGCAVLGPTPSTTEAGKRRATDRRLNFFLYTRHYTRSGKHVKPLPATLASCCMDGTPHLHLVNAKSEMQ